MNESAKHNKLRCSTRIRPEHAELITKANSLPGVAAFSNYPESAISALVVSDEIRRSTDRICKATDRLCRVLAQMDKTLNEISFTIKQHP
jgi:hypothetical protein